ncbi:MAG: MucR family transcriptional regulator [Alphaproteobacteria bacterium]|nr:MucR family transcriptional regulator [Alphaproteobacteria bacterium]
MTEKNNNDTKSGELMLALTTEIAASYVDNNSLPVGEIPHLLTTIYQSLTKLSSGAPVPENRPEPAVPVKKSVFPDYIVCLEDGKKLKMLKRHLKTSYSMSPEQYRERWNLGPDYPLVAPNYAKQRSKLAKQIGLGTSRKNPKQKTA